MTCLEDFNLGMKINKLIKLEKIQIFLKNEIQLFSVDQIQVFKNYNSRKKTNKQQQQQKKNPCRCFWYLLLQAKVNAIRTI